MNLRCTVRSVLAMSLFIATLLILLRLSAWAGGLLRIPHALGGVAFWLVLFMPTWVPLFLLDNEARRQAGLRPFLAMVPALWYCLLIVLAWLSLDRKPVLILLRIVPVVGAIITCPLLAICARRWWRILLIPLATALVAATISIEATAWSVSLFVSE